MGHIVTVRGPVEVLDRRSRPVIDATKLKRFDGLSSGDDTLLEHVDGELDELDLAGGLLVLALRGKRLIVETQWTAPRNLKPAELRRLVAYTTGQWSDGVGENFGGELAERTGFVLDLLPAPDRVEVEQTVASIARKPRSGAGLLAAAGRGETAKVAKLLDAGAGIESRNKWQQTPLLVAINMGHVETALLLIARGADVHAEAEDGMTALIGAAMAGLPTIARALLARGARADQRDRSQGWTAREWAANREYRAVVEVIDGHGRR